MKEVTGLFAMVPESLLQNDELTASEKIVVTALLLHRNQKSGACYPGIARISRLSSLSVRTVKRVISSLEKKGIIERKRRFTCFGKVDPVVKTKNHCIFNSSEKEFRLFNGNLSGFSPGVDIPGCPVVQ